MGKRLKKAVSAQPAPSKLEMPLFAPGMSLLHRAGLGGLACTLKYIESAKHSRTVAEDQIPGTPWPDDIPPWEITPTSITLDFGHPHRAEHFFERLFGIAFQITPNGLIFLPGQYGALPPSQPVLAEIHNAVTLTFLQHGRVRALDKQETVMNYDPDGSGTAAIAIAFRRCSRYKHQTGWKDVSAGLGGKPVEVVGPLSPGAVVRHVAFAGDTKIVDVGERILPLYFSIVGCLCLSVNRGVGVLVIPDVEDLELFARVRSVMMPASLKECRITSASDAALQAQVRVRARGAIAGAKIPACHAVTFTRPRWEKQQKCRTALVHVAAGKDDVLDLFEKALAELPPRIRSQEVVEGKGKRKATSVKWFFTDSRIRPLIAENLAAGLPWYTNFVRLVSDPQKAKSTLFERKGLHAMIEKIAWDNAGAEAIVTAVHEAIRQRFGRIAEENRGNEVAMKKRWGREYERWRLAFVGAKTADQFRDSLADLWSRAGSNAVLREAWQSVLPMLAAERWRLARDLALVGLVSYAGRESAKMELAEPQEQGDQK